MSRLTVLNDWESLTYKFNGEVINKKDVQLKVTWGDGSTEVFKPIWHTDTVPYSDCGHIYYANQDRMFINILYHGTIIKYPLYLMLDKLVVEVV